MQQNNVALQGITSLKTDKKPGFLNDERYHAVAIVLSMAALLFIKVVFVLALNEHAQANDKFDSMAS